MMAIWSWIADGVLTLLLIGTLAVAIRLDRALKVVRSDRTAFEALISNLGSATSSVKLGIQALRTEAERSAEIVGCRSDEADKIATDLSFLIDAAARASARLEEMLQTVPAQAAPSASNTAVMEHVVLEPARLAAQTVSPSAAMSQSDTAPIAQSALRELAGITTRRRVHGAKKTPRSRRSTLEVVKTNEQTIPSEELNIAQIKMAG